MTEPKPPTHEEIRRAFLVSAGKSTIFHGMPDVSDFCDEGENHTYAMGILDGMMIQHLRQGEPPKVERSTNASGVPTIRCGDIVWYADTKKVYLTTYLDVWTLTDARRIIAELQAVCDAVEDIDAKV